MGNCASCYPLTQTAKLLDSQGHLRLLSLPLAAAEIMLEEPGHVVSQAEDIRLTRRISAMPADEKLIAGKVYLLVPVRRVNSKVSDSDLARIDSDCRKRRPARRSSKVSSVAFEEVGEKGDDPLIVLPAGHDTGLFGCRLGQNRRWNPVLDTISEC